MAQIREANEHLVLVAIRAQALTEEAERTSHPVLGWVRLLESKQLSTERVEHAIAAIGRNASALAHMIDDLSGYVTNPGTCISGSMPIPALERSAATPFGCSR